MIQNSCYFTKFHKKHPYNFLPKKLQWISWKFHPPHPHPRSTWCLNPHRSKAGGCHHQSLNLSDRLSMDESPQWRSDKKDSIGIYWLVCSLVLEVFYSFSFRLGTVGMEDIYIYILYIYISSIWGLKIPQIKKEHVWTTPFLESGDWSHDGIGAFKYQRHEWQAWGKNEDCQKSWQICGIGPFPHVP